MTLFINTAQLKRDTNLILKQLTQSPTVITRHGQPCAALISISQKDIQDLFWEISPKVKKKLAQGIRDMKKNKGITLQQFAKKHGLR